MENTEVQINNSSYDFVVDEGDKNLLTAIKNGKRGYIDKNGTEIIPCIYDAAENYSDGLFSVCLQNKWGAIDISNNTIIPFEYEELWPCRSNTMAAKKNEKWGFIDKDNNILVDFLYDEIGAGFLGEICVFSVVLNGKCGLIDRQGNVVEEFIYDKMQLLSDNGEFIRIQKGKYFALYNAVARVFLTDFNFEFIGFINNDRFEAIFEENRVFIDKNGKII